MNAYYLQCFSLASVDQVLFACDQYAIIGDQWLCVW